MNSLRSSSTSANSTPNPYCSRTGKAVRTASRNALHLARLDLVAPQLHGSHASDATSALRAGRPVGHEDRVPLPTHGKVEPDNEGAPVPTCPMMIRREVDGKVVPETCGQPLTAYMG